MKIAHKHLIVAACLAALGASASAQVPQPAIVAPGPAPASAAPGPMHGRHMMQDRMARHEQRRAEREARLKQILQIAPAQESAWNTWIAARRPSAMLQRPDRAELAQLPTPQRIDRMRAFRSARFAEMDRRGEATKAFYAALTPAQQKAFDALTATRGQRGMGGGHWRHHHG